MAVKAPTWDLSDFYPAITSEEVTKDISSARKKAENFKAKYVGKLATLTGDELAAAIKTYEQIEEKLGKLMSYAQLCYAAETTNPKVAQFYQNTYEAISAISLDLLFFTLQFNKIPEKIIQGKLRSAKLKKYAPWIRDVRAFSQYQLSDEVENLLHEQSVVHAGWVRLFDETLAQMSFDYGKKTLNSNEIFDLLSHKSRSTREKAAKAIAKGLAKEQRIFSLVTNTLAKLKSIEDNKRGFVKPISRRNLANFVEDEVVDTLISTVKANYKPLSHRYYKWKAKQLKLKKMEYWDRNAPLPAADNNQYSWVQAKKLVLGAYGDFSLKLAEIGEQFFDRKWIDAQVRAGKDSGAFSHPTVPSVHPYILMNFHGKTRDVMTLAHELGHGVHQVLSAKQGALMADTPLTLAETASVFGEMLTFQALVKKEKNTQKRKMLIAGKVEDMLNTVVRQVAFCEFERLLHDARSNGELSTEELGTLWMKVQKESLGPAFTFKKEYQSYWMYIPHFIHSPFYVYAYAFGDCLVNSLYAVYQQADTELKQKSFEKKYLDMLSAGGTLWHKELLQPFGLDASQPDFWQKGLNVIKSYIDELEA
jgi:oligoendopeptidase F